MANNRASLAEMMGNVAAGSGGQLSLSQLPTILGDSMPELPRSPVGRHRLIRALQQRFGSNFRALPGVTGLISEFDNDMAHESRLRQLQALRVERKK